MKPRNRQILSIVLVALALAVPATAQGYVVHYLVSDGTPVAAHLDPFLVNAWGLARAPDGPWLVAATESDYLRFYSPAGVPMGAYILSIGSPTGMAWYGGPQFMISVGGISAPSRFLIASEGGLISGFNPNAPSPMSQFSVIAVDRSAFGANYKAIAQATSVGGERLYATDFYNSHVDVFDGSFALVPGVNAFVDPNIPAGYAPFGIRKIENSVYVTYALRNTAGDDSVAGAGLGYVSAFTTSGAFLGRIASNGPLNAPWGLALAPATFGRFAGHLLVGNFGDGRILAYSRAPSVFKGYLSSVGNVPIVIDGLWGIDFGNGNAAGPLNTLFFTAGPGGETHGLFGSITATGGTIGGKSSPTNDNADDDPDG